MYSFFAFTFKVCKKCYYDPQKNYLEKYQFNEDFKFVDAGFQNCSFKKLKAKNHGKMGINENTQNSHSFFGFSLF